MIEFRKTHPSISRSRFWREDVKWYGSEHLVDMAATSHQLAFCLHGASQRDSDVYVMINAAPQPMRFGIHEGAAGDWQRIVDTSLDSPADFDKSGRIVEAPHYVLAERSVVVLLRLHGRPAAQTSL